MAQAVLAAARAPARFGPFPVAEAGLYTWKDAVAGLEEVFGRTVRTVRLPSAAFIVAGRVAEWAARPFSAVPVFDERRARDLAVHTWTCDTYLGRARFDQETGPSYLVIVNGDGIESIRRVPTH